MRRLAREHIHTRGAYHAGVEGVGQRLLVHERPAPGVDEYGSGLHQAQAPGIGNVVRVRRQRAVQAHNIAIGKHLVERGFLHSIGQGLLRLGGESLHFHAERQGYARRSATYMTEAHDAHGLAGELCQLCIPPAEIGSCGPSSGPVGFRVVLRTVGDGQQMGKHHLRHRCRAVGRDIGHGDAALAGGSRVDHIVARGQHTYIFQPWQRP